MCSSTDQGKTPLLVLLFDIVDCFRFLIEVSRGIIGNERRIILFFTNTFVLIEIIQTKSLDRVFITS